MSEKPSALSRTAKAISDMPPVLKRSLVITLIVLGGGIAGWIGRGSLTGAPSDSATMVVFENWRVVCPSAKEKDKSCEIMQDVVDEKAGQRIARVGVITEKGAKQPSLILTAPLGVLLEPGVGLRLGGDPAKSYPYKTCFSDGCVAIAAFDDKLADTMLQAQDAGLTLATPQDGKTVEVPFSMKGFVDAHRAYLSGEAKRKSWWWRLWL